jgi:branched-chain amino acid transport system substrate-binding protein
VAATGGAKAPIVIGLVGWLSGVGGFNSGPVRDGVAAWAAAMNAKGGVNGHQIQLLVGDDGGNDSKSVSIVRDFVENKHAIAIVGYGGGSAVAAANYAKSKSIPFISGLVIEQVWAQNPMMFAGVAATEGHYWGMAKLAKEAGVKKIATVYCTEVAACTQTNDVFLKQAKEVGIEVVYQGRISFTQPDYTAECIQARSAGADGILPITENNSLVRFAQSCSRQNFKPKYLVSVGSDAMTKIPELDGAIAGLVSFPWFLTSGSPALDEYGAALRRFAPSEIGGKGYNWVSTGWIAGKMLEKALQGVSDKPTSQEILQGLWKIKGDRLGGLTPPLTFNQGQPAGEVFCVYSAKLGGGKWNADRGMEPICK